VAENGNDIQNAPVYLFTDSGSYLGKYQRTDAAGNVSFMLPDVKTYKFRVDYNGSKYWSGSVTPLPSGESDVDLLLDLLSTQRTNDPNPTRFDGTPPEPEKIMLASLGTLTGLLSQTIVAQTPTKKIYYYLNDHLGTPIKVIDQTNTIVWSADYKPFGKADITVDTFENNFRFPGQCYDQESDLHYNYHRYYQPDIGRYLRADPIGIEGGINLFAYVQNNPANWVDPLGLEDCDKCSYCPNGKWDVDHGYTGNLVIGIGGSGASVTFTCLSNNKKCKGMLYCAVAGIIADIGGGWVVDFHSLGSGRTISGKCNKSDIKNYIVSGTVLAVPLKLASSAGVSDNSISFGLGLSFGIGYAWCHADHVVCDN